jgi:predicted HicB family RNase H-like nuclease
VAKRKPTDIAQLGLRLPEKLRKKIEAAARTNGWSLNRELVRRLERSFVQQEIEDAIKRTAEEIERKVVEQIGMRR